MAAGWVGQLSPNECVLMNIIPESWLKERLNTTDERELARRDAMSLGLSESDLNELIRQGPSPTWMAKWEAFISQRMPGDELWFFESPRETWSNDFAGRAGYALVRSRRVIDVLVSRKS